MGFFGNLWSGVKRIGKSIGHGVRKVGKFVSNVARPVHRAVSKGYGFIKNIPVIGAAVSNSPAGAMLEKGLDVTGKVLDTTDKLANGDYVGAAKTAANAAGLRI